METVGNTTKAPRALCSLCHFLRADRLATTDRRLGRRRQAGTHHEKEKDSQAGFGRLVWTDRGEWFCGACLGNSLVLDSTVFCRAMDLVLGVGSYRSSAAKRRGACIGNRALRHSARVVWLVRRQPVQV